MSYFRLVLGDNQLGIESDCAWAEVGSYSDVNIPCDLGGQNCQTHTEVQNQDKEFYDKFE